MKVRVFLPTDEALESFPYGEFDFDVMPSEGHILRFADFEGADYPVEEVGYIQEGRAFLGAIWLGPPRPHATHLSETAAPHALEVSDGSDGTEVPVGRVPPLAAPK